MRNRAERISEDSVSNATVDHDFTYLMAALNLEHRKKPHTRVPVVPTIPNLAWTSHHTNNEDSRRLYEPECVHPVGNPERTERAARADRDRRSDRRRIRTH